ncbi:50S ribosomal protein L22 [Candidatus Kaiserbacteria bacterium CG10_big_fil_rev_8_21_14_0_10_49_17]|uniref:Large ribosomal subunit protein uL22 n=1 Tax=Candidatus Kaiserbacteria bacterium CG10_big_fil_rev_8_21_14_0_10_49_17 TaxID=1974609 RepID=A0A2M6WEN4_9BACT|nr:MAG: 50S ribosomal protein L22 [Candidatus Kaiserbacteria bacterium CG10_big_fil_rev_8_21_14_0_10_49_17]
MKAKLSNYRQAPRKVRLVADAIRGKRVDEALTALSAMPKRASEAMKKVVESATANAAQSGAEQKDLRIKTVTVDEGMTFMRFRPRSRGRATPIRKHTSHINIELEKTTN